MVNANVSGDVLVNIFKDDKIIRSTMRSVCIIDGDKHECQNLQNYTISLPGNLSPENLVFEYVEKLYKDDSDFWRKESVEGLGYTKLYYQNNIRPHIYEIKKKIESLSQDGKSTHGVERECNKKVFKRYTRFFTLVMKRWIVDNPEEVKKFYEDLHILFCKVAEFHDINPREWRDDAE